MKKISLTIILFIAFIIKTNAQSTKFDGYWLNNIPIIKGGGKSTNVILKITNNTAKYLMWDKETKRFIPMSFIKEETTYVHNNMLFSWLNTDEKWSETQTFSLSYINSKTLQLVWVRQVNNIKEDKDNSEWHTIASGHLNHYTQDQFTAIEKEIAAQ